MYIRKTRSFNVLLKAYGKQLFWYAPYVISVFIAYEYLGFKNIDIKMSIATVLGFAVALLLGFRTSATYDRWWEARKIWGAIVNDSRSLTRQMIAFTGNDPILDSTKKMAGYQIAFCYALKNSLRDLDPLEGLEKYISNEEVDYLRSKNNKPNEILKMMSVLLAKLKKENIIDSIQILALDETIKGLCDSMGKAERINNTVFPVRYKSYIHRGIIVFTIMLPYGMLYSTGPLVVVICIIVSFFFFMLESIAMSLQDPFTNSDSDIPMTALSRTIEINLLQLVEAEEIPEPIKPSKKGVLM